MNQRRNFLLKTSSSALVAGFALAGCTTTGSASSGSNPAARRHDIDAGVDSTLEKLYSTVHGSRELVAKSRGILVFPSVLAAGFWVGGQYGEGALRANGATAGWLAPAGSIVSRARVRFESATKSQPTSLAYQSQAP